MLMKAFLLVAVIHAAWSSSLVYECRFGNFDVENSEVTIDGCDEPPCQIKQGESYIVHFKTITNSDLHSFQVIKNCYVEKTGTHPQTTMEHSIKAAMTDFDGNDLSLPLPAGQELDVTYSMSIPKDTRPHCKHFNLVWLGNDFLTPVFCFWVDVDVSPADQNE